MFSCNAGFQVFGLGPWFSLFWNERDSESYVALRRYIGIEFQIGRLEVYLRLL